MQAAGVRRQLRHHVLHFIIHREGRASGQEVVPMGLRSADGQSWELKEVALVPGPGASERDRRRLQAGRTAANPTETNGKHLPEDKLA